YRLAARRRARLEELTPRARERMEETALAFVQQQGNAAAMARALHLHPQTARYRRAALRETLGGQREHPPAPRSARCSASSSRPPPHASSSSWRYERAGAAASRPRNSAQTSLTAATA